MATTLHAYYALAQGIGVEQQITSRYVDIGDPLFVFLVHRWSPLMRGRYATLCLNEVTSLRHGKRLRDYVVRKTMTKLIMNIDRSGN